MQKLTNKEEEVMIILWRLKKAFVKELMVEIEGDKPHYNARPSGCGALCSRQDLADRFRTQSQRIVRDGFHRSQSRRQGGSNLRRHGRGRFPCRL